MEGANGFPSVGKRLGIINRVIGRAPRWGGLRRQRGFTLIELLVVMGIIGVLAGIVTVSVSGTGETSNVAQARSDAGTVESAASSFFTDQDATFLASQKSVTVTAAINEDTPSAVTQEKSSRWPEVYITENSDTALTTDAAGVTTQACDLSVYCDEFPTTGLNTDGVVISVDVADSEGVDIDRTTFLEEYTAVDFATLTAQGYTVEAPVSAEQTAEIVAGGVTLNAHNFLWLFRKSTSAGGGGENDGRNVAVFKLASATITEVPGDNGTVTTVSLSYAQIL